MSEMMPIRGMSSAVDWAAGVISDSESAQTQRAARLRKINREHSGLAFLKQLAREDTTWKRRAVCRGSDTRLFFSEKGNDAVANVRDAKAVCAECPVTMECADYGVKYGHGVGVWGGLTPKELRRWRKMRLAQQ